MLDDDKLLEPGLNEVFLYHGTSSDTADVIAEHGFDERVASLQGLYGAGIYFANQSCKASQYCEPKKADPLYLNMGQQKKDVKTLIVARVALGDPFYTMSSLSKQRRPPERSTRTGWKPGLLYDSVVVNAGDNNQVHRELILYDHKQAYPEYIVRFREY